MIGMNILALMMIIIVGALGVAIVRYVMTNTPAEMVTAVKNLTLLSILFVVCWILGFAAYVLIITIQ